jgi:3-dehydroquinate synthase
VLVEPADGRGVRRTPEGFEVQASDGTVYGVDLVEGVFRLDNPLLAQHCRGRTVLALVSPTVDRLYGAELRGYLGHWLPADRWSVQVIPTGEDNKTLATADLVCGYAKAAAIDRRGLMLSVGGGITADIVGFAASMYARGIAHIKVNTTLIGQVDVGVGVKTGVNGHGSKNLLGAYHPAVASLNDPTFLRTLPAREIRCGLAEILKVAAIRDGELFATLERHPGLFQPGPPRPEIERRVIEDAMRLMMQELCSNLREHDLARLVDFGHTFSPVIEVASGYRIRHGEAVAIDMAVSSHIATLAGQLTPERRDRLVDTIQRLGLPVFDPEVCTGPLLRQALERAWLHRGRRLNLVVPTAIGAASFLHDYDEVPDSMVATALTELAARSGNAAGSLPEASLA